MLLALVLIYQISATLANPYSKHPYLLNVGNEELDKTNTEQIRVSLPGGSAALRYPAFGVGDTISNIKVTAIGFIKDVQAKIVDGGPGYNYVVLAFFGNSGLPYNILVTVQLKPDMQISNTSVDNSDPYGVEHDTNDGSEDVGDEPPSYATLTRINSELMQPNPNVHIYDVNSKAYTGKEKYSIEPGNQQHYSQDEDDDDDEDEDKDKDKEKDRDEENEFDEQNNEFEVEVNKNAINDSAEPDDTADDIAQDIHSPTPEQYTDKQNVITETNSDYTQGNNIYRDFIPAEEKYNEKNYDDDSEVTVNSNLFRMYEALKPHLNFNSVVEQKDKADNDENAVFDYKDDPAEIDQMFNDEEVHKYNKYTNNNFDTDDTYAVEY